MEEVRLYQFIEVRQSGGGFLLKFFGTVSSLGMISSNYSEIIVSITEVTENCVLACKLDSRPAYKLFLPQTCTGNYKDELSKDDFVDLAYLFKVAISCKKGPAHTHTAGGYPYIIYGNTRTFFCEIRKDNGIFASNVFVNLDYWNIKGGYKVTKLLFVVPEATSFHETVKELSYYDGR